MSHRSFVIGAASTGAWARTRTQRVRSQSPQITHGVQAGDVQTGRALIWARCSEPARMVVEWDTTERFDRVRRVAGHVVGPDEREAERGPSAWAQGGFRTFWLVLGGMAVCSAMACGGGDLIVDPHVIVDGIHSFSNSCRSEICPHNENTDLAVFGGATYLVHRTAESQVLGPNSSLRISRSDDHGKTWTALAVLPAIDGRDLRDPCFYVVDGKLAIKALTRLAVFSLRDADVDTIAVGTVSPDGGQTWSPLAPIGPPTWSYWRIHDDAAGVHYAAAYEDGDKSVALFSSVDGANWSHGAEIYGHAEDTPLETELVFMPSGKLLALVRMDGTNDEILGNVGRLRTKVCWASPPFAAWDCSRELDGVRLDGPIAFFHGARLFAIARKHLIEADDRKRTALYELTGDFDGGELTIVERGEFPSAGDTSYAGIAAIDDNRVLVSWYSSSLPADDDWGRAIFEASDIWQATLDLSQL